MWYYSKVLMIECVLWTALVPPSSGWRWIKMYTRYMPIKYQKKLKYPITGRPYDVEIDLVSDFEKICQRILKEQGIRQKNKNDCAMDYYRLMHRLIENKPRNILKAKEFFCPQEYESALKLIEKTIKNGANLHPFMTRNLKKLQCEDLLLSDWGIYHLHLSERIDPKDGFMQRSDKLLMVRIDDENVYFITIVDHNEKNVWSLKRYIEIIKANWPQTIERHRMKEVHLLEKMSDEDYAKCRKANATTFIELDDGSCYGMMGGGYMSDGTAFYALKDHDNNARILADMENILIHSLPQWLSKAGGLSDSREPIRVEMLGFGAGIYWYYEKKTKMFIRMRYDEKRFYTTIMSADRLVYEILEEKHGLREILRTNLQ